MKKMMIIMLLIPMLVASQVRKYNSMIVDDIYLRIRGSIEFVDNKMIITTKKIVDTIYVTKRYSDKRYSEYVGEFKGQDVRVKVLDDVIQYESYDRWNGSIITIIYQLKKEDE